MFSPELADRVKEFSSNLARPQSVPVRTGGALESVRFDPNMDSRSNFPTERHFNDFKKQRDLLYEMLTKFENQRNEQVAFGIGGSGRPGDRGFKFADKLGKFMQELFAKNVSLTNNRHNIVRGIDLICVPSIFQNDPVNMYRFARLFREQMLTTCVSAALTGELADPLNRVKLEQRIKRGEDVDSNDLSALSANVDMDTKFFGAQAFFKEFIVNCNHFAFLTHLRSSLVETILEKDKEGSDQGQKAAGASDTGMFKMREYVLHDHIYVCADIDDEDKLPAHVVANLANTIVSLKVAAKFLALIETLPFRSNSSAKSSTETTQALIAMRQQVMNALINYLRSIDFHDLLTDAAPSQPDGYVEAKHLATSLGGDPALDLRVSLSSGSCQFKAEPTPG